MEKIWFRVREVSEEVGIGKRSISKRIEDGKLKARREGNRYLIHREEVDRLKQNLQKKETPSMAFIAKEVEKLNQKMDRVLNLLEEMRTNSAE